MTTGDSLLRDLRHDGGSRRRPDDEVLWNADGMEGGLGGASDDAGRGRSEEARKRTTAESGPFEENSNLFGGSDFGVITQLLH